MHRMKRCPREGCEGTWTLEGRVIRGHPRTKWEPAEPSRFQVEGIPFAEDEHSCDGKLTEEEEANMIQDVESDPAEPYDDYDPALEEQWWER